MNQNEIDEFSKKIANRIKELRILKNLTQKQLSAMADIDERQIQRLENNQTSATFKTLYKVTSGLGVGFPEFFSFDERGD